MSAEAEEKPKEQSPAPAESKDVAGEADAPTTESKEEVQKEAEPAEAAEETKADEPKENGAAAPASRSSGRRKSAPVAASASAPPASKKKGPRASEGKASGGSSVKKSQSEGSATYKPGDIVLARLKGYPSWPSRVADPDVLPTDVAKARTGKGPNFYVVQFFDDRAQYAWMKSSELSSLSSKAIAAYLSESHRKETGGLHQAYRIAKDPAEWIADQDERLANALANAAGEDELEEDDDQAEVGEKRKKASGAAKQSKKKAKTETKKSDGAAKTKKEKAEAKPESKPAEPQTEEERLASDPECIKVKEWRHKLQRAFLGKGLPTAEEMPSYDDMYKSIEEYKNMSIDALTYSKIGKVMKKISALENIPRNEEFNITKRSADLMHKWQDFISSHGGANGAGDDD